MNKPKFIEREGVGGYNYKKCPSCNESILVDKPRPSTLILCGKCNKSIEFRDCKYCAYCGEKIDWQKK